MKQQYTIQLLFLLGMTLLLASCRDEPAEQQSSAWDCYERGLALADSGQVGMALTAFYQALDLSGNNSSTRDELILRRDVNEQIASQFLYKGLSDEALEYAVATIRLDSLLGDSVARRNPLFVKHLNKRLASGVPVESDGHNEGMGETEGMDEKETMLAQQALQLEQAGLYREARDVYQRLMQVSGLHTLQYANMKLVELSLREGNTRDAQRYMRSHREWLEVVRKYDADARALLQLHVLRKDSLSRVAISRLNTEHRRTITWLVSSLAFLTVAVLFLLILVRYNRQKRTLLKFKLEKLREMQALNKESHPSLTPDPSPKGEGRDYSFQQYKPSAPLPHREGPEESLHLPPRFRQLLNDPDAKLPTANDWQQLKADVNEAYPGFSERLFDFCRMSAHEHHICLLLKLDVKPSDIARLTAHSDEAIGSSRRRLYQKAFGQKGSPKDWDNFIQSL